MAVPSRVTFELIQTLNFSEIDQLPISEIRFILPSLVRMCHCDSLDVSRRWLDNRRKLQNTLLQFYEVNDIKRFLDFDYQALEAEVKKELQLRLKLNVLNSTSCDSFLVPAAKIQEAGGPVNLFETGEPRIRMKLIINELIQLMVHMKNFNPSQIPNELFDTVIYLDEIVDLLYFAILEMPSSFQLIDVVETLLVVKNGLPIICRLVANFPDSFHEICTSLIERHTSLEDESNFLFANRVQVLRRLCQMNPSQALIVREEAVELCRMPNLVIMLTLDHIKYSGVKESSDGLDSDVISFITGILLSNNEKVKSWFSQYIKKKNTDLSPSNCFLEFRQELLKRFREVTAEMSKFSQSSSPAEAKSAGSDELVITEACIMLRLYCALHGVASMKFLEEETQAICRMIISRPPHSYIGVRFVSISLCMILAFPQLVTNQDQDRIVEWIKWLVKEESYFGQKTGLRSSFGEMLLLIAIHFHSNQMQPIGELVSATIGIELPLRINALNIIRRIFTQEIFTEQTVTAHAVKVPVTKNLSSAISGFLPIHCIYQLLNSRAFTKNKVPIKDWILRQLSNCVPPIHQKVPALIEAYVNTILVPTTLSGHMTNEAIAEEDLRAIFKRKVYSFQVDDDKKDDAKSDDDSDEEEDEDEEMESEEENELEESEGSEKSMACLLTSQILLLYYILLYEDVRLANISKIHADRKTPLQYSSQLISRLPIFYLVQKTQTCSEEYGILRPPLLRLLAFHYPHLCIVRDWLPRPSYSVLDHSRLFTRKDRHLMRAVNTQRHSLKKQFKALSASMSWGREACHYYEYLSQLPDEHLWPVVADFIETIPWLLDRPAPRMIRLYVLSIWFRLNHIFPTKLWVMTVNSLAVDKMGRITQCWDTLVDHPTAVLRCDPRAFRIPELMEIILHMLQGFLLASKIKGQHLIIESHSTRPTEEERKKREDLFQKYTLVNESLAIQILLECCLAEEEPADLLSSTREVQGLVCSHIHQCFIADVNLAKMVHFQGYPRQLIPLAVSGIPSMHICLDFIPEILSLPDLKKQAFAIDLTSHINVEYPIIKAFSTARLCFEICNTQLTLLPNGKRTQFYLSVLPALERMCSVFPPLVEGFIKLLVQLAQKNLSALSANPALRQITSLESVMLGGSLSGNAKAEQKEFRSQMIDMSWPMFEECVVAKLPGEEALAFAIHKAFGMLCQLGPLSRVYKDETV